jgi:hypothetical protein
MAAEKASIQQATFIGGEWGPLAYGLSDDPHYSTAMTLCLNGYPCEEGSWLKRSSTQFIVPTHLGNYANILAFDGSETCSFAMEFTSPAGQMNGNLRFLTQSSLISTNDAQTITSVSGGQLTLSGNPSWSVGDEVMVVLPANMAQSDQLTVRNQVCTISTLTPGTPAVVSLSGFFTGGVVTTANTNLVGAVILHVLDLSTPYTGGPTQIQQLRAIQAEIDSIILCPSIKPYVVQISTQGTDDTDPVFTFNALTLVDGPYLNPQSQSLNLSALTGSITLTAGSAAFAATDVGRAVRIFTQPAIYNPSSTYSTGDTVTDATGAWWIAIGSVPAGVNPGTAATINGVATVVWGPAPTAGSWAWGLITAYTNSTTVSFTFDTTIPNMTLQSANGTTAYEWQLGVYSTTTGYPTCGVYYEGRLFLAGCVPNRFDTTTSNGVSQIIGTNTATFSPTDPYGNVLDSSGISEVLNSKGINQIQWMIGDGQGVVMGTLSGETLVAASALGDPITPTSIQAHEVTRYGSENIEAVRADMALIFAQKYGRRVMEYLDDAFSSKWSGRHLNKYSKHLTASGIQRLAYQEEPIPIIWTLMNNGTLAGCTYRRFSRFVQTDPEAQGWHRHMHGAGRAFTSMCVVPGKNGLLDRLFTVTASPPANGVAQNLYFIEIVQPPFDPSTDSLLTSWMVDQCGGPGPGNSGYDCGGGNSSSINPSGFYQGSDTTTPTAPAIVTQFQNISLGQSPPAGGELMLNPKNAVFFPGSVVLYNLPHFPSATSPSDETSMSMSVWIGKGDLPLLCGALISSPELAFSELGTKISSSLLGGATNFGLNSGGNYTGGNNCIVAASQSQGILYPYGGAFIEGEITGSGNTQWCHVMISAKSLGNGSIEAILVVNDTVVFTGTTASGVGSNSDMWEFNTSQDLQKDNGLGVWSIGGQFVQSPVYDLSVTQTAGPVQYYTIPPLIDIIAPSIPGGVSGLLKRVQAGLGYAVSTNSQGGVYYLPIGPGSGAVFTNLMSPQTLTINSEVVTVTGDGGPSNIPGPTAMEQATGYIGNVCELWVQAGTYIDWTNSVNRYKFHEYDSITESWGPIPLGTAGAGPGFGTPWIYCTGGPEVFPLNNSTGKYLTELDTTAGLINFQTGLGGGLQESQLSFP